MDRKPMRYRPVNRSNADERQNRLTQLKYVTLAIAAQFVLLGIVYLTLLINIIACSDQGPARYLPTIKWRSDCLQDAGCRDR